MSEQTQNITKPVTYDEGLDMAYRANEAFDQIATTKRDLEVGVNIAQSMGSELGIAPGTDLREAIPTLKELDTAAENSEPKFNALSDAAGSLLTAPKDLEDRNKIKQDEINSQEQAKKEASKALEKEAREKYSEALSKCPVMRVTNPEEWHKLKDASRNDPIQEKIVRNTEDFARFTQEALDKGMSFGDALTYAEKSAQDIGHSGSSFGYMMNLLERVWERGDQLKEYSKQHAA